MRSFGRQRLFGIGILGTGVVCPCHVLVGAATLAMGGPLLSPAAQDGLHAVYVPIAVLVGAVLLGKRHDRASGGQDEETRGRSWGEVQGE